MAAPQVTEVLQKVDDKILVYFDSPLDDSVEFPVTSFSVNYGRIPISGASYFSTAAILLVLDKKMTFRDKVEINYQPPDDLALAIRGTVGPESSNVVIRRNAVRAFYKLPVKNLLPVDETPWMGNSNLGGGKKYVPDPDSPEGGGGIEGIDICGDGSIVIGGGGTGGNSETPDENGVAPMRGDGPSGSIKAFAYPNFERPSPRTATPDDFVLAYGLREAIQLTNIDDADAIEPNNQKLWMAIEDATALIDNYITQAGRGGKLLISSNRRRTALIIARYYLDTVRRREDVKADYEQSIQELDKARSLKDIQRPDIPWWADPCNPNRGGGVRSHRIPQYYNGVSGKGLDGWWVDSSAEEKSDFRDNNVNSQNNNDDQNGSTGGGSAPREPEQPTDDGGMEVGGSEL